MTKIFAKLMSRKQETSSELEAAAAQAALMTRVSRVAQAQNGAAVR
jgi:hypothetical protein